MEVLLFLIIILLIVLLAVISSKVNSIKDNIDYFSRDINELNKKLSKHIGLTASKDDIKEILENLDKLKTDFQYGSFEQTTRTENVNTQTTEYESLSSDEHEEITEEFVEGVAAPTPHVQEEIAELIPILNSSETEENKIAEPVITEYPELYEPSVQSFINEERTSHTPHAKSDDGERNFIEKLLGENWLSKVGIITLVLGIAFFVKYAIDQDWINEVGRVGIGLLTGGIIIGIAHKLKNRYTVFSSILVGGGISVFYITITIAFREYEIFGQNTAFILLIITTIFSVILSYMYDRKELAVFSLLGGFASPLMVSSGTGNYMVLFTYLLILNTGMLSISFLKRWRIVGIISYALSLVFFWTWLFISFKEQYITVTCFAGLFFLQFYLLAVIDHFKNEKKITPWQAILILTNNLSLFLACLYIFDDYVYNVKGIIAIVIALINAVIMVTLFRKSEVDRNLIYLIIAVVMTFVSLAVPIQLNGHVITMFWAAETVILLILWQKSRIKVFQTGFLILCTLTIISYLMDISYNYTIYNDSLSIIANRIFITGIVVIAAFALNLYLLDKERLNLSENTGDFHFSAIIKIFRLLLIGLIFIVPFLEMNYQLEKYTDAGSVSGFRYIVLATYSFIYIAALAFIYKRRITDNTIGILIFRLLFFSFLLYSVIYSQLSVGLRYDIFMEEVYDIKHFFVHFLSLPAIVYIAYLTIGKVKKIQPNLFSVFCWAMIIASVIILSVETEHVVILLFGDSENYNKLLYDIHTFGYPILWGIIAMILMVWGLKQKEVLLRKISLIFFGLIIVKFYAYDVWRMSQTGRIVSFVLLGVILLLVSFLQQKIKTLVKEDKADISDENDLTLNK